MSEIDEPTPITSNITINKRAELHLVWILPIIALLVSGWLIYRAMLEKGPSITISFPTAEGLEVDKTKIKYLNVEIGKVTAINIDKDLKTILVSAEINPSAKEFLHERTSFWVVRPQIGLAGISGLGTLISGAYIEIKPGDGADTRHFIGLEVPPIIKRTQEGRNFIIETRELGALRAGTPIHFHGINAGEITSYKMQSDTGLIQLNAFISAPYDRFVRKNTNFWSDGGIDLSASAEGFKVRTAPLASLLSGGIAFEAAPEDGITEIQPEYSVFKLYDSYAQTTEKMLNNTLKYVMYFTGSVRGLTEGAPVQVRGITIGEVKSIHLEIDEHSSIRIPVVVEIGLDRIKEMHRHVVAKDEDLMSALVKNGLRAQLQTGSLITGQLLVDLDFHPESKPKDIIKTGLYPEFPTAASSLEQFSNSAKVILDKIAKLPLQELTAEINKTLQNLQQTSNAATSMLKSTQTAMSSADKAINKVTVTLNSANQTLGTAQQTLDTFKPGSDTQYQLHQMLQELTGATHSIRQMADILEQQPESLLRGKQEPKE